jgi:hypothetical protein
MVACIRGWRDPEPYSRVGGLCTIWLPGWDAYGHNADVQNQSLTTRTVHVQARLTAIVRVDALVRGNPAPAV